MSQTLPGKSGGDWQDVVGWKDRMGETMEERNHMDETVGKALLSRNLYWSEIVLLLRTICDRVEAGAAS